MTRWMAIATTTLSIACGGSSNPNGSASGMGPSVTGTVAGSPFRAVDAISLIDKVANNLVIDIADGANACQQLKAGQRGLNLIELILNEADPTGDEYAMLPQPGIYTVGAPSGPSAHYARVTVVGSNGMVVANADSSRGSSGSVHLDSFDGTDASGSASATFNTGDTIEITFPHAPLCAVQ